jgi:hypothetical protein
MVFFRKGFAMRSEKALATLDLLTAIRDLLTADGVSPLAITWGPWWEEAYYAV